MSSIFQRANPAILDLFQKAGAPKKVMCLPLDYAKKQHTALVCNGEGVQLRAPFYIHNNPEGVAFLEEVIAGLCKKHAMKKTHVFFGGEDGSAIAFNFIHALRQRGYLGIGINARDAALERQNQVAAPISSTCWASRRCSSTRSGAAPSRPSSARPASCES